jgi:hypothetical protein
LGLPDTRRLTDFFSEHVNLGLVPLASGGVVRRDTWEDYFDQVVRGIGKSMPIVPLDGVGHIPHRNSLLRPMVHATLRGTFRIGVAHDQRRRAAGG